MQKLNKIKIPVLLSNKEHVDIEFASRSKGKNIKKISELDAREFGEAAVQIKEGYSYEYKLTDGFELVASAKIVRCSKLNPSTGIFSPGNYVGTLSICIQKINNKNIYGTFQLEVESVKTDYRTDYRLMLEEIAEKCAELIMQHSVPISQKFITDYQRSTQAIYQSFSLIKAIIDSEEFDHALHKIVQSPITVWENEETQKDISRLKRLNRKQLRQIAKSTTGSAIKVTAFNKSETVDAPENRFIKHVLQQFLDTCALFYSKLKDKSQYAEEVLRLQEKIIHYLGHQMFKDVGKLYIIPLSSPILQRKEGYREVLRAWIMFTLAAQMSWDGGDDVFEGGKRDVATLYEYWLFFKLHDLVCKVFQLEVPRIENLIETTADGLGLKLKRGNFLAIDGICHALTRKLHVQLSYNRLFDKDSIYPHSGSWTTGLRPDYTLSIWPLGISPEDAEKEELIVHIHFDAKYRIEHLLKLWESDQDHDNKNVISGKIKNEDLLKMHTYRDAIRRTAGAYVLYPGDKSTNYLGYHEVLPGLGAFPIRPSKENNGILELERFLNNVVALLLNRASQREKMSLKTFEIHKLPPTIILNTALPEPLGPNRNLLPEETSILVAYYKSQEHLDWIISANLYNTRVGSSTELFYLDPLLMSAKYLLLHNKSEKQSDKFYKLSIKGGRIFSKEELKQHKYPTRPSQKYYLVFEIDSKLEEEFRGKKWDVTKLEKYTPTKDALPFVTHLGDIMQVMIP